LADVFDIFNNNDASNKRVTNVMNSFTTSTLLKDSNVINGISRYEKRCQE